MRQNKRKRKGFTLAETLIVVVILGLLTAAGVAGISAVMATRVGMIQTADAEILGSTAFQALSNELRFGHIIEINKDYVILDSVTYGPDAKIELQKDDNGIRLVCSKEVENESQNDTESSQEGNSDSQETKKTVSTAILSESTYSGLSISGLEFGKCNDNKSITVLLTISGAKGELWSEEFAITPLNGIK